MKSFRDFLIEEDLAEAVTANIFKYKKKAAKRGKLLAGTIVLPFDEFRSTMVSLESEETNRSNTVNWGDRPATLSIRWDNSSTLLHLDDLTDEQKLTFVNTVMDFTHESIKKMPEPPEEILIYGYELSNFGGIAPKLFRDNWKTQVASWPGGLKAWGQNGPEIRISK